MSLAKPSSCSGCVLYEPPFGKHDGFSKISGAGDKSVLIVAEALGEDEELQGIPLIGKSGHFLFSQLARVGLERDDFTLSNTILCRPPKNALVGMPWEEEVIAHCAPNLDAVIDDAKVAAQKRGHQLVILALGRTAFKRLHGLMDKSPELRVDWWCYPIFSAKYGVFILGAPHPSYIMRGSTHISLVLQFAAKRAVEIAEQGLVYDTPNYLLDPDPTTFGHWVEDYRAAAAKDQDIVLSYDIETPYKVGKSEEEVSKEENEDYTILRCGFAYQSTEAVSVPWNAQFAPILEDLFASPGTKVGWNSNQYDDPRILQHMPIHGSRADTMLCLHARCKIPLWDGGYTTIKDIVDNKHTVALIGLTDAGTRIPVSISAWRQSTVDNQHWLSIKSEASRFPIICTPDHKLWTNRGWVEAAQIQVGDRLPSASRGSDDVIHGTLLGDGAISVSGVLQIGHAAGVPAQHAWMDAISTHFGATRRVHPNNGGLSTRQDLTRGIMAATVGRSWREKFYQGTARKRFVPPPTMGALAIWYGDDGNYHRNPGMIGGGRARFMCHAFLDQTEEILRWFKSQFGESIVFHQEQLVISKESLNRFFSSIAPWLHPSMSYKLREEFRGLYNGWLEQDVPRWGEVEKVSVAWQNSKLEASARYCVDIDHATHAFFTKGGLVHNCWHVLNSALPKSLGFVAPFYAKQANLWKHLADVEPARYNAEDALRTLQCYHGIKKDLIKNRQWEIFERHVVRLNEVLGYMSSKGVLRDNVMRDEAEVRLQGLLDEVEAKMEATIPPEARKMKIYKKTPTAFKGVKPEDIEGIALELGLIQVEGEVKVKVCPLCGCTGVVSKHFTSIGKKRLKAGEGENACVGLTATPIMKTQMLWGKPLPFKVSKVGLLAYQASLRHSAIVDRRENKVTFDEHAIEQLVKKYPTDPLYPLILEHRGLQKLLSTYIGKTVYE